MTREFMASASGARQPAFDLLTEKEAADLLTVTDRTMRAWRYSGSGPDFIKLGAIVRYRREALESWLQSRTVCGGNGY